MRGQLAVCLGVVGFAFLAGGGRAGEPDAGTPYPLPQKRWTVHRFVVADLEIEFLDAPVTQVLWDTGGGTLFQTVQDGPDPSDSLDLSLRAEPEESLEGFRRDHPDWKMGAPERITLCGQPAQRLSATREAQHITCVITASGNHPAYFPAARATTVVFSWKDLVVRLTATSRSDRPGAHEAEIRHFFESVRCL